MKKVLVAGATGYLGRFVVEALKERGYWVRALGRNSSKLNPLRNVADELAIGEVTDSDSLAEVCDEIDVVFSSVGITRQKDGLTYQQVDYQGNKNLLSIAQRSGVSKFVYVHVLNANKMPDVAAVAAKQAFVDELEKSLLDYTVVCPTGFFSDMEEFLDMARAGRVHLFGDGSNRINPIHGADLAQACVDALESEVKAVDIGGPEIFTYREIAELAFKVLDKPSKISSMPRRLVSLMVGAMRLLTPVKTHGPLQFLATVMTMDVVGEQYGKQQLEEHFRSCTI
ncbi:MAG: SDR family oxidoreductase [Woeseiaceae bacterium]|nr:SDR family oxidoreductase [Woeseiaceae bacterium]